MAVVTLTATRRGSVETHSHGYAGTVKCVPFTVEVGSADSATSTYTIEGDFPSNARILGASTVYWDDLASSGSPTLDFGVKSGTASVTADPDALNDGLDAATVNNSGSPLIKDKANYGKRLWEFVNGVSADPKGTLKIYISLLDADVNAGGTISGEVFYTID